MKPTEVKQEFIQRRAEGQSFSTIAEALHISKSTCSKWEQDFQTDIAQLKQEELNSLYESYHMKKADRIKKLGSTLERVDNALDAVDLKQVAPEKLLDYKLKYTEALKGEYVSTEPALEPDSIDAEGILRAYTDLLNRTRSGEVTQAQAQRESLILSNLLRAYENTELKAKLDKIESILGGQL